MGGAVNSIFPGLGSIGDILGGPDIPQSSAGNLLERIARDYYNRTNPVRQGLIDRANNFVTGNLDVTQSPMYGAIKSANEGQFKVARDNALATLPTGGALDSALVNLQGQKAANMAGSIGNLASDELNRAYAFANPQASMSGLGSAGYLQSQRALAQAQQQGSAKQGAGQGLGAILGSKPPIPPA